MRRHVEHQVGLWQGVIFLAGVIAFVGGPLVWFASPWPTEAARYAWREWEAPALALALDRGDTELAMEIGNTYFGAVIIGRREQRYDPALAKRAFEKALAIEPGILWGHYSLARIAFISGDSGTALAEIDAELAANPANLRSLYIRGLIYGYRALPGDLAKAEEDFTRFTQWAPSEWAGYNDLAWILAKEGKYEEVESVVATAFGKVPGGSENPWLLNMLGTARLNLGDRAGAVTAFTQALAYAQMLTEADWRTAYSGNSPASDEEGLEAFRASIKKNLAAAGAIH
jgi:predicted Zn-dependent protease